MTGFVNMPLNCRLYYHLNLTDKKPEIYLIGICGVAMATLAGMLKETGYNVRGSDSNVYPPMSNKLKEWGIHAYNGYKEDNIGKPDLVIIGNAISRGNPEAEFVLNNRIPYISMAQAIYNYFLKNKEIISISGTHGKTTTTALLSHILITAGEDPSCFIGGVSNNLNSNYRIGNGRYFVIEGDEYDSAFFEKIPKFIQYRPHHLILTSLEFDHADIYGNLGEIELWFKRLVNIIPAQGHIIFSNDYSNLREIIKKSFSKATGFGKNNTDYTYKLSGYSGDFTNIKIAYSGCEDLQLRTKLFGEYNIANITAATAMAIKLGIKIEHIKEAAETFTGVKRRQDLIFNGPSLKIFEDFAHHPTAINFFLSELKEKFSGSTLWAIYEPRSATSRRNVFQKQLPPAFNSADYILLKNPFGIDKIPEQDRLDINMVVKNITGNGKNALLFESVDNILDYIFKNIQKEKNNIIAIMSNGGFDDIYNKIITRAKSLL
jgi:UDP-N-acetylmuramate: L-alanyl-gamma-D-glutamyl-meso-diaminopimelate ligase